MNRRAFVTTMGGALAALATGWEVALAADPIAVSPGEDADETTSRLQAALDLAAATGRPVALAAGLYLVNCTLTIDGAAVLIAGAGSDATLLVAYGAAMGGAPVISIGGLAVGAAISGCTFVSDALDDVTSARGIEVLEVADLWVQDCDFRDGSGALFARIEGAVAITTS